jgi:hypothetical protein
VFTPTKDDAGAGCYRMAGTFALGRICSEILRSQGMASATGTAASWIAVDGVTDYLTSRLTCYGTRQVVGHFGRSAML